MAWYSLIILLTAVTGSQPGLLTGSGAGLLTGSGVKKLTESRVSVGRTAEFKCDIPEDQEIKNLTVSWLRLRDVNLLSVGNMMYTQDSRITVQCENSTECYLYIAEVRETDSGLYQCQANTPPGSWETRLEVVQPQTKILGDKELFINPHSLLNLTCQVFSPEPPHAIFWKYGEKVLTRALPMKEVNAKSPWTANLLIKISERTESGRYVCSPSNTQPEYVQLHVVDGEALLAKQSCPSIVLFSSSFLFTGSVLIHLLLS